MNMSKKQGGKLLRSTSFFVYESADLLSCTICTTWRRSSSPSFWRPSASLSMSTCFRRRQYFTGVRCRITLTFLSTRFFFFTLSSPPPLRFLTPFSSPGTGPDSRNLSSRAGLGFLKVYPRPKPNSSKPKKSPVERFKGRCLTMTCLDSYRFCWKFRSWVILCSLSGAPRPMVMSNSPHPSS
jgi:hypothetical protein